MLEPEDPSTAAARTSPARTCVFTIVSRNYLHFARTLMAGVARHAPAFDRVVCLCDTRDGIDENEGPFRILPLDAVDLPDRESFIFRYTVLELNTAVKPYIFRTLFERDGYDRVIYFDPDIFIYHSLDPLSRLLDAHEMVLTPHLIEPLAADGHAPSEHDLLLSGTYNLGFVALRRGDMTRRLLPWWEDKLRHHCVVDIERGLFVDQKWMDLAPALFQGVAICREPGWNVAYWNLPHRRLTHEGGGWLVHGCPLVFFHFSGISPDGRVFSKHQDRFSMAALPPPVHSLVLDYCAALRENEASRYAAFEYGFDRFPDRSQIPRFARRVFREDWEPQGGASPLNDPATYESFVAFVNQQPPGFRYLTRGAIAQYAERPDLQQRFPHLKGVDEAAFAHWFVNHVREQVADVSDRLIEPVRDRLRRPASGPAPRTGWFSRAAAVGSRVLYRAAWAARKAFYPFTTVGFRQRVNDLLLEHSYRSKREAPPQRHPALTIRSDGLNVIGYLRAESGVGQAARASIAAAQAAGIPTAARNIDVSNVSRKQAGIPAGIPSGAPHDINLFHINADQMPVIRTELGPAFFDGRYNIAVWYWELPELPDRWQSAFVGLQEIWAATAFCQQAISAKSPVPVVRMPPCLLLPDEPASIRTELDLPEDAFLFLTMADGLSFFERKNPLAAVQAFLDAFPDENGSAGMVIKLINSEYDSAPVQAIRELVASHSRIHLIDDYLAREDLDRLISSIDAVVSLHRSEGFGLPLAEAMYYGKPVIATGWSGNMDFMSPWNSFPIRYRLVQIVQDIGPYERGQRWAEPDLQHAAECMRRVSGDEGLASRLGHQAREDIRKKFSPEAAGQRMQQRLAWIRAQNHPGGTR